MMLNTITFEPVHQCWQQIILDAVRGHKRPAALPYLGPIEHGHAVTVWDYSEDKGYDNKSVLYLMHALTAYANRFDRAGLEITAADCRFLWQKLSVGDLTVISKKHLN